MINQSLLRPEESALRSRRHDVRLSKVNLAQHAQRGPSPRVGIFQNLLHDGAFRPTDLFAVVENRMACDVARSQTRQALGPGRREGHAVSGRTKINSQVPRRARSRRPLRELEGSFVLSSERPSLAF